METIKSILKIIVSFGSTPAIIVHELSHYTAALLMMVNPKELNIKFYIGHNPPHAYVDFSERAAKKIVNTFRKFIIDIAPLITIICFVVLAFFDTIFIFIVTYQLVFFYWSFMSDVDSNYALKYLGYPKKVKFNRITRFENWLYFEGLSKEEYCEKYGFPFPLDEVVEN